MRIIDTPGEIDRFLGISVPENIGQILHHAEGGRRGVNRIHSLMIPGVAEGKEQEVLRGFARFNPFEVSLMRIVDFVEIIEPHAKPLDQIGDAFQVTAIGSGYIATAEIAPDAAAA
ncbi:hypothetical protein HZB74_02600 [Candidatus Saccharibacteria bacterium]|nr:hypothetical protein [Candidatus Saccharibacteria bacterium]